jgi:hypothetical protein
MDNRRKSAASLERATDFIWRNARLLERTLFAHAFEGQPADTVTAAVLAYRNADGGFGHAMEPDVRAPDSMPLHCEIALRALRDAKIRDASIANNVCDFLGTIADRDGHVPIVTAKIRDYPRAAHWTDPPAGGDSPNPTASLVGLLTWQGVEHRWLSRATEWCWARLEKPIGEAHEILNALTFLEHAPDRSRAEKLASKVAAQIDAANWYLKDPASSSYGVTPLQLCPRPDSIGSRAFTDDLIEAHLDGLAARQMDDGGWPITWTAPSPASEMEWRGRWTLEALLCQRAHHRL